MPDEDWGHRQLAVAVGVVAMQMGVDGEGDRGVARDLLHGAQEGPGPPLGGTRVDEKDPGVRDDGPGVVEPPRAVWLDPGMDAVGHLIQAWFLFIAHRFGSAPHFRMFTPIVSLSAARGSHQIRPPRSRLRLGLRNDGYQIDDCVR